MLIRKIKIRYFLEKAKSVFVLFFVFSFFPYNALSISSTNFSIEPLNTGNSGGIDSNSSNYKLDQQQIGDVSVDKSTSSNYKIRHGHQYPDSEVKLNFSVIPEKRIPTIGNNSTRVIVEVYAQGGTHPIKSYSYYDTDNNGNFTGLKLDGISPGVYDISIKGYAHLRKRLNNIALNSGTNTINFTSGAERLLCGDVYTNSSYLDGDNKVNSVDVTYLVSKWSVHDTGVSDERADVDENQEVNSLDMTKIVNNYAKIGD